MDGRKFANVQHKFDYEAVEISANPTVTKLYGMLHAIWQSVIPEDFDGSTKEFNFFLRGYVSLSNLSLSEDEKKETNLSSEEETDPSSPDGVNAPRTTKGYNFRQICVKFNNALKLRKKDFDGLGLPDTILA
jgi:hypothetical protein